MKLLSLLYFLHFLRHGMIFPLIPLYVQNMGYSGSHIGMTVSSFSLLSLILAIPAGRLTDKVQIKYVFLWGVVCNLLYSILLFLSNGLPLVLIAQLFGGLAFLFTIVSGQTYVGAMSGKGVLEKGFGLLAFAAACGQTLGPFIGGWLLALTSFQDVYLLAVVISAIGLSILFLPKSDKVELAGRASTAEVMAELKGYLKNKRMLAVLLFTFGCIFAVNLRSSFLPVLLKAEGKSEENIGLLLSVFAMSMTIIRLFLNRFAQSLSREALLAISLGSIFLGVALVPLVDPLFALIGVMFVFGLGFGISQPLSMIMVSDLARPRQVGLAMGLRFTLITSGTFLSPLVFGWVVDSMGLKSAFYLGAGFLLFVGILLKKML